MSLTTTIQTITQKITGRFKKRGPKLEPAIIVRANHPITRKDVSRHALDVLYTLHKAGFEAYLVGGCVRDLLLNLPPKDFDVATNAKPEQVKKLFRNCRLIGRRFRLAHVYYGRHIIEVATLRAAPKKARTHEETGMIMQDNVFGTIDEDALRRDFTINALYYNIADFSLIDYCNGMQDIQSKTIRLIGDPDVRFKEDPVRMLRAARFAAKLDFTICDEIKDIIPAQAHLMAGVSAARIHEECLKLFEKGHALKSLAQCRKLNLMTVLLPHSKHYSDEDWQLIEKIFANTDERIRTHQTTSPAFIFAALLWPAYCKQLDKVSGNETPSLLTKYEAMDQTICSANKQLAIPKRITLMVKSIWEMQHRLEFFKRHQVHRLLDHSYFRAGFDFFMQRAESTSPDLLEKARWWNAAQQANAPYLEKMLAEIPEGRHRKKRRGNRRRKPKNHEA